MGALQNPSTNPKARVTYAASYPDALGRVVASADYGTNGGTALSRWATIPARSDSILVNSSVFDSSENTELTTDPSGIVTKFVYDALGRETSRISNFQSSSSSSSSSSGGCPPSVDANVTVDTAYNADGNVKSLTARNATTGDQKTDYTYGTTLTDSLIASSLLKRSETYPDSVDGTDKILFEYNRQSEIRKITDQEGTIRQFDYDKLGRQSKRPANPFLPGVIVLGRCFPVSGLFLAR